MATSRGEQSRSAIVRAAIPLLARQGYRGASLAAIAAAVHMSQPGVLHHFPSKERLLLAVLEERDRANAGRVAGALTRAGADPMARCNRWWSTTRPSGSFRAFADVLRVQLDAGRRT